MQYININARGIHIDCNAHSFILHAPVGNIFSHFLGFSNITTADNLQIFIIN